MNPAYQHLLVNHVSLFAALFGAIALAWSLWSESRELRLASVLLFSLAALSGWMAVESWEHAEKFLSAVQTKVPGLHLKQAKLHEEAAEAAMTALAALAVASFIATVAAVLKNRWLKKIQLAVLALALVALGLLAYTAKLGGPIRHTEIEINGAPTPTEAEEE